jgi:hypothetical protein
MTSVTITTSLGKWVFLWLSFIQLVASVPKDPRWEAVFVGYEIMVDGEVEYRRRLDISAEEIGGNATEFPDTDPKKDKKKKSSKKHFMRNVDPMVNKKIEMGVMEPSKKHVKEESLLRTAKYDASLQTAEEVDYLNFHRCFDEGEQYAAAWLITKEHLLKHPMSYNLTTSNTELASFIMFDTNAKQGQIRSGTMIQALDVMDFSVIHLSAYERLLRRHRIAGDENLQAMGHAADRLKGGYYNNTFGARVIDQSLYNNDARLNKTVVIFPWLGSETGAGNSKVTNRFKYLDACFWSFYAYMPHVVVAVKSKKDLLYVT